MTKLNHRGAAASALLESPSAPFLPRRAFLSGLGAFALTGCMATPKPRVVTLLPAPPPAPPIAPLMYQALPDERFPVPAVDVSKVGPVFWRQEGFEYPTDEPRGTLIVDTSGRYLYHVTSANRATRYGVGVGRDGFAWSGRAHMAYRRAWPRWTPPDEMVARQPHLEPYSIANGGMDPGPANPLGARALYIHQGNVDTLYRLHGTPDERTMGQATSSGCIHLLNQDIIHLAEDVRDGSPIVVLEHGGAALESA